MDNSKAIYSVSDITSQIKILIEESFPSLWIEGEVSNFKQHYSGHFYFTLKDNFAQISCVMWKSRTFSLPFELEDGMKVQVFGNLRLYEKSGRYQLDSILIQQAGIGELQIKFEQLKKQLYEEGLFDESKKKPIPKYPEKIAIITSPTGAAIKDIISVIKRRYPLCDLIIKGVKVQGEGASKEIVAAIENINKFNDIDLIITGRGGGSLEDLWAFNEEDVARAIYNSKIPIISAVGHEIDYAISDFVADLRAPTPSVAAELAVPDVNEVFRKITNLYDAMLTEYETFISNSKHKINNYLNSYAFKKPEQLVRQYSQRVDELLLKIVTEFKNRIINNKLKTDNLFTILESLHPNNVLKRGYALVQKDQETIKSIDQIQIDDVVDVTLSHGKFTSKVSEKKYDKKTKF